MEAIRKRETLDQTVVGRHDLGFLPVPLMARCRALIHSYHDVHGFGSLPDILWKSRLGPFIARTQQLNNILRKASTTRSAKKAHEGFAEIASTILSLEILASNFSGWGSVYPHASEMARFAFNPDNHRVQAPLMEFYLYPPKYLSDAAMSALAIPMNLSVLTGSEDASPRAIAGNAFERPLDFIGS